MLESAADQFLVHVSGQHHHGEVACLGVRDAKAVNELAGLAHLIQDARERRAAAVDHGHLMLAGQLLDRQRGALQELCIFHRRSTQFHHDLHFSPSSSPHPYITFMFWTACPAAPLIRLSRHETMTSRRRSGSQYKAQVTVVAVQRILNLRQFAGREDPYPRRIAVKAAQALFHFFRLCGQVQTCINGG